MVMQKDAIIFTMSYRSALAKFQLDHLWPQPQLAEALGVSVSTLSRWSNSHHAPNPSEREKIKAFLIHQRTPLGGLNLFVKGDHPYSEGQLQIFRSRFEQVLKATPIGSIASGEFCHPFALSGVIADENEEWKEKTWTKKNPCPCSLVLFLSEEGSGDDLAFFFQKEFALLSPLPRYVMTASLKRDSGYDWDDHEAFLSYRRGQIWHCLGSVCRHYYGWGYYSSKTLSVWFKGREYEFSFSRYGGLPQRFSLAGKDQKKRSDDTLTNEAFFLLKNAFDQLRDGDEDNPLVYRRLKGGKRGRPKQIVEEKPLWYVQLKPKRRC
jgi:hypothetical protein